MMFALDVRNEIGSLFLADKAAQTRKLLDTSPFTIKAFLCKRFKTIVSPDLDVLVGSGSCLLK